MIIHILNRVRFQLAGNVLAIFSAENRKSAIFNLSTKLKHFVCF
ncbi:hypothetical protein JCM19274_3837 [Algibacter lectus]|uniref:Uncharacterized protein n=1 Tax=Algibacter lectus TaxID=221126 RepID=A0A090X7B7_9FLAO|nr:hypothetical protein JCM19274_3837 [Algibacter lectus]